MKILFICYSADAAPVSLSGNHPALGDWDAARAQPMQLQNDEQNGGRAWSVVLDLEPGRTIEYKFLKRHDGGHVEWEGGWNRTYTAVAGIGSISDSFRT